MAVGCGAKFAKYVLFAFNIIFWLGGAALLIIGIIFLVNPSVMNFQTVMTSGDPMLKSAGIALVVLGSITFVIGFAGCCGAIQEIKVLLIIYALLLGALMAVEIAIAVYAAVKMTEVQKFVANELYNAMKSYPPPYTRSNSTDTDRLKDAIDDLQHNTLQCCGVNSSADWQTLPFFTRQTGVDQVKKYVPASCCSEIKDLSAMNTTQSKLLYEGCSAAVSVGVFPDGCSEKLNQWIRFNYPIVVAVFACVAAIEAIGIFLALCLCCNISKDYSAVQR